MRTIRTFWLVMAAAGGACAAELVVNPGFETLTDTKAIVGWDWWGREKGKGRVEVSEERHSGERAVRIVHDGERDWALANERRTAVKPGESYKITCWMKRNGEAKAGFVTVVARQGNKLVDW